VAQLQAGTVTITTTGSLPEKGDTTISAPLDLNLLPAGSTRTLVLHARDNISITGAISDSNLATGQNLNPSLNASLTTNHGDVNVGAALALGAGNVSIVGHDFSKTAGINLTPAGGDIDIAVRWHQRSRGAQSQLEEETCESRVMRAGTSTLM